MARPKKPCKPREHEWQETSDGRECLICSAFESYCRTCGRTPCECDELYDSWRDRELEREADFDVQI